MIHFLGGQVFVAQPEDQYALPGENATFPCNLTRSTCITEFNVTNGTDLESCIFHPRRPMCSEKLSYDKKVLTLVGVSLADNGSTYQCKCRNICSKIGTLHVISGKVII